MVAKSVGGVWMPFSSNKAFSYLEIMLSLCRHVHKHTKCAWAKGSGFTTTKPTGLAQESVVTKLLVVCIQRQDLDKENQT